MQGILSPSQDAFACTYKHFNIPDMPHGMLNPSVKFAVRYLSGQIASVFDILSKFEKFAPLLAADRLMRAM